MLFNTPDCVQRHTSLKTVTYICACLVFVVTLVSLGLLSSQIYFHLLASQGGHTASHIPLPYFAHTIIVFTLIGISTGLGLMHRMSLKEHRNIVDILRLMGAPTRYISKQFQWRMFKTSFVSSLVGVLSGACVFACIALIFDYAGARATIPLRFIFLDEGVTIYMMSLPFIMGIISFLLVHFEIARTVENLETKGVTQN